jgi:hypothetical protein
MENIQFSGVGIIYKRPVMKLLQTIRWEDNIGYRFLIVPFIGKIARVIVCKDIAIQLILPPKEFIENLDDLESFLKTIDKESPLLKFLCIMYGVLVHKP